MRKLVETFFRHYLAERDLEATLSLLTENIVSIGTGAHEIAHNQAELRALLICEFEELPTPMKYEINNLTEMLLCADAGNVFADVRVRMENNGAAMEMNARFTCTCARVDGMWKIACLHMSMPASEQEEGRFFPLYFGTGTAGTITTDSSAKLMELVSRTLPGGIMGGFLEEDLPLYVVNDRMLEILGYSYEEFIAETEEKMIRIIHPDDRRCAMESIERQLAEKNEYQVEYRAVGKGGRIIWVNDIGKKIVSENGRDAMLSILTDISERIEREKQLIRDAEHDSMTKLYNRKKGKQVISAELEQRDGGILFICDIDNFKSVNDTRGHVAGDLTLIRLGTIIRNRAKEAIAVRIGGDEFALFFPATVDRADAVNTMREIQREFLQDMQKLVPELEVSLSVGGQTHDSEKNFSALYKKADEALYYSKKKKGDMVLQ